MCDAKELIYQNMEVKPFNGEKNKWYMWSTRFLSMERVKTYYDISEKDTFDINKMLETNYDTLKPEEQDTIDLDNQLKWDLIISLQDDIDFSQVSHASSGQTGWTNLKERYQPRTATIPVSTLRIPPDSVPLQALVWV